MASLPTVTITLLITNKAPLIENYQVKHETISIGDITYKIRSLLDLQQFSDTEGTALSLGISSAMWPLFGQVWPMSKILAQVMLGEPIPGRRILEIGCGLGLPSLVTKQLGGNITASDYHPLAAAFLLENATLNCLAPIDFKTGNWNIQDTSLGLFDLIIGSDILYERQHVTLASAFIDYHASPQAEVIIIDPGRGSHRAFARAMEQLGYRHSWTNLKDYSDPGVMMKGFVLRFWR
ncbi:MAG: class I SAM-dependent methyltransferase [Elainellaceae cyanobacterium]